MNAPRIHFRGDERFPHGSPTLLEYVNDTDVDVRIIQGPVESGKTVGSIACLYRAMCEIPRCKDGIRRSRWLIIRPTYSELETTIKRDWEEWFDQDTYGKVSDTEPYTQKMRFLDVEAEIVMMSFPDSTEKSLKKLRSTQFTGALINEGQYTELKLLSTVMDRTGRYPRRIDCPEYDRRKMVVMDLNAPPVTDHWILYMRGDIPLPEDMPRSERMALEKPDNWKFYVQPPAVLEERDVGGNLVGYKLNRKAENLQNMGDNPYLSALGGKPQDQIDRDFRNLTRAVTSGQARYPDFSRDAHVASQELEAHDGSPIRIGVDPGGSPGFTMGQLVDQRWYVLHAEEKNNFDSAQLADHILSILVRRFPFYTKAGVILTCDPVGGWGTVNSKITTQQIFHSAGLPCDFPAKKDKPDLRLATGRRVMQSMIHGQPKIIIDPIHCRDLIMALDGGMVMKDGKLDKKSLNANVGESFEYMLWGGGEAREMTMRPQGDRPKPVNTMPKNVSAFTSGKRFTIGPRTIQ